MDPNERQKVINFLTQQVDFSEAYHLTSFVGFRELPEDGSIKQVSIQILDAGSNSGHPRYQASVQDEDGRMAHGEPADTLDELLTGIHWFHLNEPPSEEEEEDILGGQVEIDEPDR